MTPLLSILFFILCSLDTNPIPTISLQNLGQDAISLLQ